MYSTSTPSTNSSYAGEEHEHQGELEGIDTLDQYLTFILAGEEYGLDVLCVQEIRGWDNATMIPNAADHIKGVINLRGTIVPIIDMRRVFGLKNVEYTPLTVVIVIKVETKNGSRVMGIVVDEVSDVVSIPKGEVKPPPDLGSNMKTEYIRGLVTVNNKLAILLEINRLISLEDLPEGDLLHQTLKRLTEVRH